jgi:hypothetical protein
LLQGPAHQAQGPLVVAARLCEQIRHQLVAQCPQNRVGRAVVFQADERGAAEAAGLDQPPRQLGGQFGLALAAFAAEHDVAAGAVRRRCGKILAGWKPARRAAQNPLGAQQQPAAADERVRRRGGDGAQGHLLAPGDHLLDLIVGHRRDQLRVVLLLEQHRHEPVVQPQFAGQQPAAEAVQLQFQLGGQHRLADSIPGHHAAVEHLDETAGGLDQHAVTHGRHRAHAAGQQPARHRGRGRVLGLRRLAGFQEEQRRVVIAQRRGQLVGPHDVRAAVVRFVDVGRFFEAQRAQAVAAVEHAVAVEVDHVVRLAGLVRAAQFGFQRLERGRIQDRPLGQLAQRPQRFDHGPGADAVVDVPGLLVVRPGTDQQHADRRPAGLRFRLLRAAQPPPHTHAAGALEQVAQAVVQQFPRQAQQQRGGLVGGGGGGGIGRIGRIGRISRISRISRIAGRRLQAVAIQQHGEPRLGVVAAAPPGVDHRPGRRLPDRAVQQLAPERQLVFDQFGPLGEHAAGPAPVAFQIPRQLARFDRSQRRGEMERLAGQQRTSGWLVLQLRRGHGAAFALGQLDGRAGPAARPDPRPARR